VKVFDTKLQTQLRWEGIMWWGIEVEAVVAGGNPQLNASAL